MSNKRTLYKPVAQDNAGNRERRRPLAQGRLVSKPLLAQTGSSLPDVTTNRHGYQDGQQSMSSPRGGVLSSSPPRRDLSSLMGSFNAAANNNVSRPGDQDEGPHTPRKKQPHVSMEHSPKPLKPSVSLELSDTDSDHIFSPTKAKSSLHQAGSSPEVLFAEAASHPHEDFDESEVELKVGYSQSPAKVVCHVPEVVHSDLRDTGDVTSARQVHVDQVPSVNILSDHDSMDPSIPQPAYSRPHKSPAVIREKAQHGGWMNHNPVQQQLFRDHQADNHSVSIEDKPRCLSDASVTDGMESLTQEEAAKSSKGKENRAGKMPGKTKSVTISQEEIKQKVKKKKKAPRVVASRYMSMSASAADTTSAATTSKKGPMKATDRSVLGKTSMTAASTSSTTRNRNTAAPATTSRRTPSKNSSVSATTTGTGKPPRAQSTEHPQHQQSRSSFSTTPEIRGKGQSKASTPSAPDVSLQPLGGVDVSAIAPVQHHGGGGKHLHSSIFSTPSLEGSAIDASSMMSPKGKHSMRISRDHRLMSSSSSMKHSQASDTTTAGDTAGGKKHALESMQNKLSITYNRYLQWVYLESKARKDAHIQEQNTMRQLYGLWLECEKKQKHKAELELELTRLRHLNTLDDILDMQEKGLSPIVERLSEVRSQHGTLSAALDTTRHQMPARGIYIPEDNAQYMDSLQRALEESEQLLAELNRMSKPEMSSLGSLATSLSTMQHTVEAEVTQLQKVQELVCASQSLITQESSLMIQDLQINS